MGSAALGWQAGWGVEEDGGVGSDEERYEDEMFGAGAGHEAGAGTGEATAGTLYSLARS